MQSPHVCRSEALELYLSKSPVDMYPDVDLVPLYGREPYPCPAQSLSSSGPDTSLTVMVPASKVIPPSRSAIAFVSFLETSWRVFP